MKQLFNYTLLDWKAFSHYYPPHSAQGANENLTTYMECDSCWVPNERQWTSTRHKTKTKNERAGKKQSVTKKQKSYKLIAPDTINLSLVLTFT